MPIRATNPNSPYYHRNRIVPPAEGSLSTLPASSPSAATPEPPPAPPPAEQPRAATSKPKRPKKAARPKKQPTGDYDTGYCRPPIKNRFDGSKPGPGRPKNAVSQDTLLKKHLGKSRSVMVDGRATKVTQRELAIMLRVKQAIEEKERHSLDFILEHAGRLYPQADPSLVAKEEVMSAEDQRILDAMLRSLGVVVESPAQDGEVRP